jgi:hypothetical protein
MNKRFLIAGIAASLFFFLWGFLAHGVLMTQDYMQLKTLFRPEDEAMGNMPFMILAHVLMGFAFAWIYERGISGASWVAQGVRFGIAAAVLVILPWYLIYYSIQPWPAATIAKMTVLDSIGMIVGGLIVAFVYKETTPANA